MKTTTESLRQEQEHRAIPRALDARKSCSPRGNRESVEPQILRENEVLFVMVEQILTAAEQQELALAFERNETEKTGAGTHKYLRAMMDKLVAELQPRAGDTT